MSAALRRDTVCYNFIGVRQANPVFRIAHLGSTLAMSSFPFNIQLNKIGYNGVSQKVSQKVSQN